MEENRTKRDEDVRGAIAYVLDAGSKIVALVAAISFCLSVIYDFGLFNVLDLSFSDLPSNFADHARGALDWIPYAIVMMFCMLVFQGIGEKRGAAEKRERRLLKLFDLQENTSSVQPSSKGVSNGHSRIGKMLGLSAYGMPVYYFLFPAFQSYIISATIAWSTFYLAFILHDEIEEETGSALLMGVLLIAPLVTITVWDFGRRAAVHLALKPATESIVYKNNIREENITILRYFDKGPLIKGGDGAISFVPWADIQRIDTRVTYSPYKGFLCEVTNWKAVCPRSDYHPGLLENKGRNPASATPRSDSDDVSQDKRPSPLSMEPRTGSTQTRVDTTPSPRGLRANK
jgi:hypothetical protein